MDLIRIFTEVSFFEVAKSFCRVFTDETMENSANYLILPESEFLDTCRLTHPELSDDQIKMIFNLYQDEWSVFPEDSYRNQPDKTIFNVLYHLSGELLVSNGWEPQVKFKHLFRWREISQLLGEDIFTCAYLAMMNKNSMDADYDYPYLSYPTVLHNDNTELSYIFRKYRLAELHSHLKAATDIFTINWVCLMNHVSNQNAKIRKLVEKQLPSRHNEEAESLTTAVLRANMIRMELWGMLSGKDIDIKGLMTKIKEEPDPTELDRKSEKLRMSGKQFDYISVPDSDNMSIFTGERLFLFLMFKSLMKNKDIRLHQLFYIYLLCKNILRKFMVQINGNNGFSNFQRYQECKSLFLKSQYKALLETLPVWEATEKHDTKIYEARIAPSESIRDLRKTIKNISRSLDAKKEIDMSILFHFIKTNNQFRGLGIPRQVVQRIGVIGDSLMMDNFRKRADLADVLRGIDAANSEFYCRPEVYAHAFRYLKACGYPATFHVGEDFYDIADGVRAIFEAVTFLGLEGGDRLGHALALGIDPYLYYAERHNYIAMPLQCMLDNTVWLYYFARRNNIGIDPETTCFLESTYRKLIARIGYGKSSGKNDYDENVDMHDYYESILLRGDEPEYYIRLRFDKQRLTDNLPDAKEWKTFDLNRTEETNSIRKYNQTACKLYGLYHYDPGIREMSEKVGSFRVPQGYVTLIMNVQTKMMKEISKRRLCIECCPSSNFRIGHLQRFDRHPIFRFMPVRSSETHYPLGVTVNTDDLGIFATSLQNEFSLLALALLKKKDATGEPVYSSQEVYDWIRRVVENGHKYHFAKPLSHV